MHILPSPPPHPPPPQKIKKIPPHWWTWTCLSVCLSVSPFCRDLILQQQLCESRWLSWAPVPNNPTVPMDVKQHFVISTWREREREREYVTWCKMFVQLPFTPFFTSESSALPSEWRDKSDVGEQALLAHNETLSKWSGDVTGCREDDAHKCYILASSLISYTEEQGRGVDLENEMGSSEGVGFKTWCVHRDKFVNIVGE